MTSNPTLHSNIYNLIINILTFRYFDITINKFPIFSNIPTLRYSNISIQYSNDILIIN